MFPLIGQSVREVDACKGHCTKAPSHARTQRMDEHESSLIIPPHNFPVASHSRLQSETLWSGECP